jgi:hypothetical protein
MIQKLFLRPLVRRRMATSTSRLGIILERFALDLQARGYAVLTIQSYVQVTEHFSRWLGRWQTSARATRDRQAAVICVIVAARGQDPNCMPGCLGLFCKVPPGAEAYLSVASATLCLRALG